MRLFLLIFILLLAMSPPLATSEEGVRPQSVTFGLVPQQSASKLARLWGPVFAYLGRGAGLEIKFRTAPNIPEFERRVAAGAYDIAYMNPYHYTVFSRQPGYRAFAKAKHKRIKGILVVRKDSPLESPRELDGATLAFPAPAAFAASVLPRAYLKREGISFTPKYVSSHDSVYHTVAKGLYPAGGGVVRTFNSLDPDIRGQLRILWKTKGYTPHAFAAHPRVSADFVERLTQAMLAMDKDEEGRVLLKSLSTKGFESATDSDWDDVRALGVSLLGDLVKPVQ
jgi:phosphonate transport system substrate-binding protein